MDDVRECPECGMPPGQCYRICPTQDPYQGDQQRENEDYEFNSRYDDVRERYAATAADADMFFDESDAADAREDMERERNEQGFILARPVPADVNPDDCPF